MEQLTIQFRNESYRSLDNIGHRQRQVFWTIKRNEPITNRELSERLHLPINSITGRVKELRDAGLVEVAGSVYDRVTNRNVTQFRSVDNLSCIS